MADKYETDRIQALTDGVFAIAMTLMVLSIDLPEKDHDLKGEALHKVLLGQIDQVLTYILSFILLAIFWNIHHKQYRHIEKTNQLHIWINIFILIFICLVPYTTNLTSDFPGDWMTHLYFNLNLLVIALLFFLNWSYATRGKKLAKDEISDELIYRGRFNIIAFIVIALAAIVLSFIIPAWSSTVYLFLFVIMKKG